MHLRPYHSTDVDNTGDGGNNDNSHNIGNNNNDERDVCYLWCLFRCPYGDNCKFRHVGEGGSIPRNAHDDDSVDPKEKQRKKKGKCFAFKKGKCSKGDNCPFSHDFVPKVMTSIAAPVAPTNTKDKGDAAIASNSTSKDDESKAGFSKSQKDCINWRTKGKCRKGDKCEYRHDPELQQKALQKKKHKRHGDNEEGEKPSKKAKKEKQPLCVRVFGMNYDTTEYDIREFFKGCGTIQKISFPVFEDSGRSKGYCGVWFASPKAVAFALELDGQELHGRWLRIQSGKMLLKEWEGLHNNND
jgi:nucleolin